jgi:predicted N-acetyltransferase YhbS
MTRPRPIQPDELPLLGELLNDVFRRSAGVRDQDVLLDFPLAFAPGNLSNCRVIAADGGILSHAAVWPRELIVDGRRLKLGVITLVATHPEFRRRGYAARLMEDLHETMRDEQYDLGILWTGVPDFYRRLGWEAVVPQGWLVRDVCLSRRVTELAPPDSEAVRIEPYDPGRHLEGIMALHESEPVRLARTRSEYAALLSLPKIDVHVLVGEDRVSAWLAAGQACNKRGLIEYGGPADEIGALIAHAVRSPRITGPLPLVIHHTHPGLARLLEGIGERPEPLPCSKGPGCEMVYVLRPEHVDPEVRRKLFVWGLDVA